MILLGLLQDLGKVILGNIIKDAGLNLLGKIEKGFHFEKSEKADMFIKILEAHLKLNKKNNLNKLMEKLTKLELVIKSKKFLKDEVKEEIIEKIKVMKDKIKKFQNKENFFIPGSFANLAKDEFLTIDDLKKEIKNDLEKIVKIITKKVKSEKNIKNLKAEIKRVFLEKAKRNENIVHSGKLNKFNISNNIHKKENLTQHKIQKDILPEKKDRIYYEMSKEIEPEEIFKRIVKTVEVHEKNPEKLLKIKSDLAKLFHFQEKTEKSELQKKEKDFKDFSYHHKTNIFQEIIQKKVSLNSKQKVEVNSKPVDFENKVMLQIKKGIISNNIKHEITIKLEPPELGKVHIKLAMINNQLTAKITTENSGVKNVILNNFNVLQEALKEKGILLSNFQVNVSGEFSEFSKRNSDSQKEYRFKKFNLTQIAEDFEDFGDVWNTISEIEDELMLNLKI